MATNGKSQEKQRKPSNSGGLVDVLIKRYFYRDSLRMVVKIMMLSVFSNILLIALLSYTVVSLKSVEPKYFATDEVGRITPIVGLDQPYLTTTRLLSWASNAAVSVYNYDFKKYKEQINSNRPNFTQAGWAGFVKALNDSGVLDKVKESRDIVSATPTGAAIIADEGIADGVKVWKIKVPLIVSFQSSSTITTKDVLVTMVVVRTSLLDNPAGIAINSLISADLR